MAGEAAERQERGFITSITNALRKNKNKPITLIAGDVEIPGVFLAKKHTGRQEGGSEAYTDIVLFNRKKGNINLSLKGEEAPSLAGGGLRGLELIIPGIGARFMKAAYNQLIEMGLKAGDKVPDVYGKISAKDKRKIVVGNQAVGGPIHYMYIGPMKVETDFEKGTLTLNGTLTEATQFADENELYFRLRARREDQTFDPKAMESNVPKIYGRSPSRGDSAGRVVVTDKVPENAVLVKI